MEWIKIANAGAFWGDSPFAAVNVVKSTPDIDFITIDYLAELTLSVMAVQKKKNPALGYAKDFIPLIEALIPFWEEGRNFRLIANAGGLNPLSLAEEVGRLRTKRPLKIGVVTGDDVASHFPGVVSANAYLGHQAIKELLDDGADIVITGRVADPSLVVGAAASAFGWKEEEWDRLAVSTLAGHLIECGRQVTGGISAEWMDLERRADIGFPIAELSSDGELILTKESGSGGVVNIQTVKEQLFYELLDPACYLSPDVTASFQEVELESVGDDRVQIRGVRGSAAPNEYKVSLCYDAGFKSEGSLVVVGEHAVQKARAAGEALLERLKGHPFDQKVIEVIGSGDVSGGILGEREDLKECVLRIALSSKEREPLEAFSKELASLVTSGPPGVTGYTGGRPKVRPHFGYRAESIEMTKVSIQKEWVR